MSDFRFTRRQFLKLTGTATLALSLDSLGFLGGMAHATEKVFQKWVYKNWEDLHREEWKWDRVTYGTHLVNCFPHALLIQYARPKPERRRHCRERGQKYTTAGTSSAPVL